MKILYKEGNRKTFDQMDRESQEAVKKAIELVGEKTGFRTPTEIWRDCELIITIGHNIYTTSIVISPPPMALIKRRANWHNGHAYFCNGVFWANFSRIKVELI